LAESLAELGCGIIAGHHEQIVKRGYGFTRPSFDALIQGVKDIAGGVPTSSLRTAFLGSDSL